MSDDDAWVKVAMVEDSLVAELLTNLKEIKPPLTPPSTSAPPEQSLSFEWKVRQRRSKAGVVIPKIKQTSTASPTTPLSWSGATSISGGGGQGGGGSGYAAASVRGFEVEDSSQLSAPPSAPKISDMERSKVSGSCEASTTKKYRKKKTLAELKEEELCLEREGRQLKRELESIRDNLVRERTRNADFKRRKQQLASSFKPISMTLPSVTIHQSSQNGCHDRKMEVGVGKFELPDLNLSLEENPCGLL